MNFECLLDTLGILDNTDICVHLIYPPRRREGYEKGWIRGVKVNQKKKNNFRPNILILVGYQVYVGLGRPRELQDWVDASNCEFDLIGHKNEGVHMNLLELISALGIKKEIDIRVKLIKPIRSGDQFKMGWPAGFKINMKKNCVSVLVDYHDGNDPIRTQDWVDARNCDFELTTYEQKLEDKK